MKKLYWLGKLWSVLFLALVLTGCGPSGSATTGTNTTTTPTTPTGNTTTPQPPEIADFTITPDNGWGAPGTFALDASATTIPDITKYEWSVTDETTLLRLSSLPSTVNPNTTSTIQAIVEDTNGNPVNNQTVDFILLSSGSGEPLLTAPTSVTTDSNGRAKVAYSAGLKSGWDVVQAQIARLAVTATTTITVLNPELEIIEKNVGNITLTAGTTSLVANGRSTTLISATVLDENNAKNAGVAVDFVTTAGKFQTSTNTTTVRTDANGVAEIYFTAPNSVGHASISARAGTKTANIGINFIAPTTTVFGVKTSIALQHPGTYAVALTVTDKAGKQTTVKKQIILESAVPAQEIDFTITPTPDSGSWLAPGTFELDASSTINAVSYDWSIADSVAGSTPQEVSGVKTSIALKNPGTYTVTLTVTDTLGKTRVAHKQITLQSTIPAQEIDFTVTPIPNKTRWLAPGTFELQSDTINAVSYDWLITDNAGNEVQKVSGIKTSIALQNSGTYTITLTVSDEVGKTRVAKKQITLKSMQGVDFEIIPITDWVAPGTFQLQANTTANAVSYNWSVLNASGTEVQTVSGVTTSIALQDPGMYTVILTVTDTVGQQRVARKQMTLRLALPAPEIDFTITPASGLAPGTFTVDASKTPNKISYAWLVTDNNGAEVRTASGMKTSIALLDPGTYTVQLTVTDVAGSPGVATKLLTLTQASPQIFPKFTMTQAKNSYYVDVNASTTTITNGTITEYQWDVFNSAEVKVLTQATGAIATLPLSAAGLYRIELTVTDNTGKTVVAKKYINVKESNPLTAIIAPLTATKGPAPLSVLLDGSGSTPAIDSSIKSFTWEARDKKTGNLVTPVNGEHGARVTLVFPTMGEYVVTMSVADENGETATTEALIIAEKPLQPSKTGANVEFTVKQLGPNTIILDANKSFMNNPILSYTWTANPPGPAGIATGMVTTMGFTTPGTYVITLTITDSAGVQTVSGSQTVTVL